MSAGAALVSERVRARMVERLREQGIRDGRVLAVIGAVPRHRFVEPALASRAYEDCALPIGHGQFISRPYVVARAAEMALEAMADPKQARVLDVGTGCGYAAAVFASLFAEVYSIERVRALHERARSNLRALRLANLRLVAGDGIEGLPSQAPFDAIIAAAAGERIPPAWVSQLRPGGRVVAPVGTEQQKLMVVVKDEKGAVARRAVEGVRFVPLRPGMT
jgi:protein-L-isoaspartate(D-aspartate) O-methyltransferase